MTSSGPKQVGSADLLSPEQKQALQTILGSNIEQLFDPQLQQQFFQAQVADPAIKQFQEQILPAINEQFIGQGAASSSGLNRAVTQAGSDLQGQLAASLAGFQQQGQQNQLNLLLAALGKQAVQPLVQEGSNPLASIFGGFGAGFGKSLGGGIF